MVSGYNRGGVTTHAPSGDGNSRYSFLSVCDLGYNPRSVRGRKLLPPARLAIYARLQPTPRQGTETKTAYAPLPAQAGYNPRPVRGRKSIENLGTIWSKVTTHAPSGDDNQEFAGRRMGREELQSTPRQGTTIPYDPYDYELQFLPR